MSLVSSTQNMAASIAASIAGYMITKGSDGRLENYPKVGIFAIAFTIVAMLASRLLTLPNEGPKQPANH